MSLFTGSDKEILSSELRMFSSDPAFRSSGEAFDCTKWVVKTSFDAESGQSGAKVSQIADEIVTACVALLGGR